MTGLRDRLPRRLPGSTAVLALALMAAPVGAAAPERGAGAPGRALTRGHPQGIWKAAVPPKPMRGEFDDFDPIGIEAGARIKADCSLNWTDPDDRRLYCFSSGTSLEIFLEEPQQHLADAWAAWRRMSPSPR